MSGPISGRRENRAPQKTGTLTGAFIGQKDAAAARFAEEVRPFVEITDWLPDPSQGYGAIKGSAPALVFAHLGDDPCNGLGLVKRLVKAAPGTLVFILAPHKSPDLILEAFRLGAADFLVWPVNNGEALAAVRRAVENVGAAPRPGEIYTVFSLKGGQGISTVALNLADHVQRLSGDKVLLIDLNLYLGDIGVRLNLGAPYSPFDLHKDLHRLDRDLLFSSLLKNERGFYILSCPDEISDADRLQGDDVTQMLSVLTNYLDYLIIDLPHDFSTRSLAALEAADNILLLVQQELAAVKITLRVLDFFRELGYDRNKIHLILNRYLSRSELEADDLSNILQQPVFATLANDYKAVSDSIATGKTVDLSSGNSPFNRDVKKLAAKLTGIPVRESARPLWQQAWSQVLHGLSRKKEATAV